MKYFELAHRNVGCILKECVHKVGQGVVVEGIVISNSAKDQKSVCKGAIFL